VFVASATALAQEHAEVNNVKNMKPRQANAVDLEQFQLERKVVIQDIEDGAS
jgi:hypothetical protein